MTIEELSMSKSACAVAVAEVVLHRTTAIDYGVQVSSTIPYQQPEGAHPLNDIRQVEESPLSLLASALLRIDSKITSQHLYVELRLRDIEEKIAMMLQRQEQIIHTLDQLASHKQGGS